MAGIIKCLVAMCCGVTFAGAGFRSNAGSAGGVCPIRCRSMSPMAHRSPQIALPKLVAAVAGESQKSPRNWKMVISVVDPNGGLVYLYRMEQAQVASVVISQAKARTAARFRRPTEAFFNAMQTPAGAYVPTLEANACGVTRRLSAGRGRQVDRRHRLQRRHRRAGRRRVQGRR